MMWILGIAHTLWLSHINLLGEILIDKDVNIKLAKARLAMECNVEHGMNGDRIDHGIKSLIQINTRLLLKSFSKKPSFIPSNKAIGILFDAKKNPFFAHNVLPRARRNERPSVISDESIILILHGLNPLQILESSGDSAGFKDRWKNSGEAISWAGFNDGTFRSGLHGMVV